MTSLGSTDLYVLPVFMLKYHKKVPLETLSKARGLKTADLASEENCGNLYTKAPYLHCNNLHCNKKPNMPFAEDSRLTIPDNSSLMQGFCTLREEAVAVKSFDGKDSPSIRVLKPIARTVGCRFSEMWGCRSSGTSF